MEVPLLAATELFLKLGVGEQDGGGAAMGAGAAQLGFSELTEERLHLRWGKRVAGADGGLAG